MKISIRNLHLEYENSFVGEVNMGKCSDEMIVKLERLRYFLESTGCLKKDKMLMFNFEKGDGDVI